MVCAVVVQDELRSVHSRSAWADLDRFLSTAVEHDWPLAGTVDALALSQRPVLDGERVLASAREVMAGHPASHDDRPSMNCVSSSSLVR